MSALTGGKVNYYLVKVDNPQREEQAPYQAECEDIISALSMTFNEGCEFKALWRTAAARLGNGKPGRSELDQAVYDAEKRVHYSSRSLRQLRWETRNASNTEPGKKDLATAIEWTNWYGGTRPLSRSQKVEVVLRNGVSDIQEADFFRWEHQDNEGDIVRYRLIDSNMEPGNKDLATAIEWTIWRGGICPVSHGHQMMEFVLRNNKTGRDIAKNLHWGHDNNDADIVMYRLID